MLEIPSQIHWAITGTACFSLGGSGVGFRARDVTPVNSCCYQRPRENRNAAHEYRFTAAHVNEGPCTVQLCSIYLNKPSSFHSVGWPSRCQSCCSKKSLNYDPFRVDIYTQK